MQERKSEVFEDLTSDSTAFVRRLRLQSFASMWLEADANTKGLQFLPIYQLVQLMRVCNCLLAMLGK